jgi:hypothetical protein
MSVVGVFFDEIREMMAALPVGSGIVCPFRSRSGQIGSYPFRGLIQVILNWHHNWYRPKPIVQRKSSTPEKRRNETK